MAQVIRLSIAGTDYTKYIDLETLEVDNNVIMTSDSCTVTIQLDGELPRPKCGEEFIWCKWDTVANTEVANSREFGGVVVNVDENTEGTSLIYNVTAKSYEQWFNRHLVAKWYQQGTPDSIVKQIVSDFVNTIPIPNTSPTQYYQIFTTNNVKTASFQVIPQYYNYSKATDAIKLIADQIEWGFYIDYYRDVHFFPAEFFASPLPSNTLDVDSDLVNYGDLVLTENGEQIYNKVFLRGFKTRSKNPISMCFQGDGQTVQWSIGYRASSVKGDVVVAIYDTLAHYNADTKFKTTGVPTPGGGGTLLATARDIVDGAPDQASASGTAYIHYTQHLLRVPNWDGTDTPVASGKAVGVFMYYMADTIYMGQDVISQREMSAIENITLANGTQINSDGVYEFSQEDKSLTNSTMTAVQAKGQLLIMKYGIPQITGTFTSFTSGWKAGQYFQLITAKRFGVLNETMYIQRVTKKLVNNINGQYVVQSEIQFANSPYLV